MERSLVFPSTLIILLLCLAGCEPAQTQETDSPSSKGAAIAALVDAEGQVRSIEEAMAHFGLPALTVAVIEDYEIAWTGTWGVKDKESKTPINENTAFSTASISKALTATLFAMLEEDGLIDLGAPVSHYLQRWPLPESQYTDGIDLTLEHLLSHTAGTTQHGFADFYEGDVVPDLVESLQGKLPGYDREIEFTFRPGTNWKYSGGGYVLAQMAVEDQLQKPLAELADHHIFGPLQMTNTTMKQPNEKGFLDNVAKAHDENGRVVRTGLPITPQVAPSGMWSTPVDMARFLIEMQRALRGDETKVISPDVAKRVTDIVTAKVLGGWSLGWERRFGYGNYEWFSHGGANTGIGGHIYATMENGNGIAFFGNGPNGSRMPILNQLRDSILKAHGWYLPLDISNQRAIPPTLLGQVAGEYEDVVFGETVTIAAEGDRLFFAPFFDGKEKELIYVGEHMFIVDQFPSKLLFESGEGTDASIRFLRNNLSEEAEPTLRKR